MSQKIVINPVTRISGFMEIEVEAANNKVVDAMTKGMLFRGFEKMLKGRSPFDAVYFTERICGICSTAHSVASSAALEDALQIRISNNGRMLRDIIHGCEFLQNHIRHFYLYTVPDYVRIPEMNTACINSCRDYRLPSALNGSIAGHYVEAVENSRMAHEMLAVLGGKAPHNHGVFIGGIAAVPSSDKILKMKSILKNITAFIEDKMIPDVYEISGYYSDYFEIGKSAGNFLSFGCFNGYDGFGTLYLNPGVYIKGKMYAFDPQNITEKVDYSLYDDYEHRPFEGESTENVYKQGAYSWVKAPRYNNLPLEVGPLARQWISGEYRRGISAMDRIIARVLEAKKICSILDTLLDNVDNGVTVQESYELPEMGQGMGLVDTTRGALGHWVKIENRLISFYQIITPSAWNFSTRDNLNYGPAESALIGTFIKDMESPVELGRVVRSFDPCISCGTHIYTGGKEIKEMQLV